MLQASRGEGRESGAVSTWYSPHSAELDVVYKEKVSDIHTRGEDLGETMGEMSQLHRDMQGERLPCELTLPSTS